MNAHEGGEGEYHGGPQYADLSNAQVMDQLQQQNPNQMQYQDDEELQEEEESKLIQVFNFLKSRDNGYGRFHRSKEFHLAQEVVTPQHLLVPPSLFLVDIITRGKKKDSNI